MYSFVEIQESFPNLNDIDGFNKLFKKSPSAFAESRGSSVHNVWVLPGHILVSLDEGHKLYAYDLVPKQNPWPQVNDFMTSNQSKRKGQNHVVLDVFCTGTPATLHMFIVLKNSEVHIWKFVRPSFEWQFVSKFHLSASKNVQVTSLCFDKRSKLVFWCERRTPTQCCVCKGRISLESGKDVILEKLDILHNCPPIQLFLVGPSGVLLHPTANSPAGLTMYWSITSSRIQLHLWNYLHNGVIPISTSTDFQSLVTESISLWINQNANDAAAIAYCTHPVTQELLVLESTCNLYSTQIDGSGKPYLSKLCTLCKKNIGEINPRKSCTIFAFKKFLGLLLEEHELLIFETYTGKLVWKSDCSKNDRVKPWVSQGDIPQVGLWCPSFMNVIRSESVIKQAEEMLKLDAKKTLPVPESKVSKEYTLHLTFKGKDGKETYVVVDNEEDGQAENTKKKVDAEQVIEKNAGHTISESVMLVTEYLKDWDTKNMSCEVCLWLLNHPNLHGDTKRLQFRGEEQFRQFFNMFENPCISLALLHKNRKYKLAADGMMNKVCENHKQLGNLCSNLQTLVKQYCSLTNDIQSILEIDKSKKKSSVSQVEFSFSENLRSQLENESLTKHDLNEIIQWAAEMRPVEFVNEIRQIFGLDAKQDGDEDASEDQANAASTKLQTVLWRNVLRKDTNSFEIICTYLWQYSPQLLVQFVRMAQNVATVSGSSGFLQISRRSSFVSLADVSQRAVDSLSYGSLEQETDKERLKVLVQLKMLPETISGTMEACKLLLENDLFSEAIDLLDDHAVSSALHDRLFFMIVTTLIEKSNLDSFSTRLSETIPSNFTADDLCNLMKAYEDQTNPTDVFTSTERTTSIGDLEPLISVLFSRERNADDALKD